ncbi:response regulator transcription factor [Micromonospora matsumotoense]|uniref:response regulator transcription factor n=1 Tax=Micromonospora matsumotoense TaxID=121616 RepID=UPI001C407AC0
MATTIANRLSNREATQRLFLSVKTIEFHLGNIFRKLGVRNRTELAARRAHSG